MKRTLRVVFVLLAAAMHLVVPVLGYAHAAPAPGAGDVCSAARGPAPMKTAARGSLPVGEHHCAHAPCCAGGAANPAAPACAAPAVLAVAAASIRAVAPHPSMRPVVATTTAHPRAPPAVA